LSLKLNCDVFSITQTYKAISTSSVTARHAIPTIVTSLLIANCHQQWLVSRHSLMTSLIAVAYVIEVCLFLMLLSWATAFGGHCK